jgi:hypothetical protein
MAESRRCYSFDSKYVAGVNKSCAQQAENSRSLLAERKSNKREYLPNFSYQFPQDIDECLLVELHP